MLSAKAFSNPDFKLLFLYKTDMCEHLKRPEECIGSCLSLNVYCCVTHHRQKQPGEKTVYFKFNLLFKNPEKSG